MARPARASPPPMAQVLVLTNATGRQSASLARAASAVGYHVRAHVAVEHKSSLVESELESLEKTTVLKGSLSSDEFLTRLFKGADLAFINTTAFDDEYRVGRACVDLAKKVNIKHLVYSSMPDHAAGDVAGKGWKGLPQWKDKWAVEVYMKQELGAKATAVHTGIYHNNFTSLPYPLFCMSEVPLSKRHKPNEDVRDGEDSATTAKGPNGCSARKHFGFEWCAPFPPDVKQPWLDCEHDFGPAVLQIFKNGPARWGGLRVPIAFSFKTPNEVCRAFSHALKRPVRYVQGPITHSVPVPSGYWEQLKALEHLLGGEVVDGHAAPYWWDGMFELEKEEGENEIKTILRVSRRLWPGWRGLEEYALEAFTVEERLNGRTWMDDEDSSSAGDDDGEPLAEARPL